MTEEVGVGQGVSSSVKMKKGKVRQESQREFLTHFCMVTIFWGLSPPSSVLQVCAPNHVTSPRNTCISAVHLCLGCLRQAICSVNANYEHADKFLSAHVLSSGLPPNNQVWEPLFHSSSPV